MAVTRYYNPDSGDWELIGIGVQGPRGEEGDPGAEGNQGQIGTQVFYTENEPQNANSGDIWMDRNVFIAGGVMPKPATQQGPSSERPEASSDNQGTFYFTTDTNTLSYSDGTEWHVI